MACADEGRREPEAGATARWAELQCFFTRLVVGAGASSPSLCTFLKLGITEVNKYINTSTFPVPMHTATPFLVAIGKVNDSFQSK